MAPALKAGTLALLGPPQVPALTEFRYVRVTSVDGEQASVKLVGPGEGDDDFDEPIETAVLCRRSVGEEEAKLWPGSFVGHPVAYVQPDGPTMDTWSYGIVTGYAMKGDESLVHLRHTEGACKIMLAQAPNVLKVDWIDYVLQVEAGTSTAALNAAELRDRLEVVRALCATSRTGLAAKAAHELTVSFEPTALVPVIKPTTLQVVSVPRQHVLDCALKRKSKKGASMFVAPPASGRPKSTKRKVSGTNTVGRPQKRHMPSSDLSSNESDGEVSSALVFGEGDLEEDKQAVLRQNRPFTGALAATRPLSTETHDECRPRTTTSFRPTLIEQRIHDAIGHPDHAGKDPQFILEYEQQARENDVEAPPVLRASYDFSFDVRGLSVMHFTRVTRAMRLEKPDTGTNMVDFSRKNTIRPAVHDPAYLELMDALMNLHEFGLCFYNDATVSVLQAAVQFMASLAEGGEPDRATTRRLGVWINSKLGRFRGLVLSSGLAAALRVVDEFHVNDRLLRELLYDQQKADLDKQKAELAALTAKVASLSGTHAIAGGPTGRSPRSRKQKTTPKGKARSVMDVLPKQGQLELCMKYLSKSGCTASGNPAKCISEQRAHFRPNVLPVEVKEHIAKHFATPVPSSTNAVEPEPTTSSSRSSRCQQLTAGHVKYMDSLTKLSEHCQAEIRSNLARVATSVALAVPVPSDTKTSVDLAKVDFLTQLAIKTESTLPDFVRLLRGQTAEDPRPSKDLYDLPAPPNAGLHETWKRWNAVVTHGVVPDWLPQRPPRQRDRPRNHRSIERHMHQVWRHIRKGQDDGRYLVVRAILLQQWREFFLSPVGVVDKDGPDGPDVRIIDDNSFPVGASINDFTDRSHLPEIHYNPPRDIANRIFTLRRDYPNVRINIKLGDVAGAFRHVPIHADHVHMFAFVIEDLLVIDLSCGFGWCASPAWYYLPGSLINGLYERGLPTAPVAPPLGGSFWCDDHTCVEADIGLRCVTANLALRRAMATVLGPRAINESKFTAWSEQGRALGLLWNTRRGDVSIPLYKIQQAHDGITALLAVGSATKTTLQQLLGRLRHVMTCCPPARAFYQRLQDLATSISRNGRVKLDENAVADLQWLRAIVSQPSRFNRIPVSHFAAVADPVLHVHMDASDDGLCALEPTLRQYIRVRFPQAARTEFVTSDSLSSINVRELQSAVLAALLWGPIWARQYPHKPVHVCFWIDNMSAVSWVRRRASRNPRAQLYNRLLSLAEFQNSLACTARHVPGVDNIMADAGSRAWSTDHPLHATWTNLSSGWMQVPIQAPYDDLFQLWENCSEGKPLPELPPPSIESTGINGAVLHR